jgi:HD superfamily phosphohydrolase YqeK
MAQMIHRSEFEGEYAAIFSEEIGAPTKTFRMALGALIVNEKLGISDRETVEQIRENPYLQYFIEMSAYSSEEIGAPTKTFRMALGALIVNEKLGISDRETVEQIRENPYLQYFIEMSAYSSEEIGAPTKTFRMALGALIVNEKLGISDRETVEQIRENPYLQYFIEMSAYSNEAPFDPSMLVHFRERIDIELVNKLNQEIIK